MMAFFFWFFIAVVAFAYIGYAIVVAVLMKLGIKRKRIQTSTLNEWPPVTLVVALYNEEDFVEDKIRNTFQLDYPEEKLHIIFITDGSTDATPQLVARHPRIKLMHQPQRAGKIEAINRAVPEVGTELIVFCDANTFLNEMAIKNLVRHFEDPKVGGVAGEKKIMESAAAAGAGEGFYWKYESKLKKLDAGFYSVVGAAGELFAVRKHLYQPVEKNVLLDDFIISMRICQKGFRVNYEPDAFALEAPSLNIREEQKRKVRISAGGVQSVLMLKPLLNIFRYGRLSFLYISHRVLRWVVCPFLLPLIFLLNVLLVVQGAGNVYIIMLALQVFFYATALLGWFFARQNKKVKAFYIPYYFVFMNWAVYLGLMRFWRGKQNVAWEKAARQQSNAA